jgi:phytoene dehydrogenase-like protein
VVELTLPSTLDDSLAPPGRHVASLFVQYAPVVPADSPDWRHVRERVRERTLAAVEALAPGFGASIERLEVLAAPDLERVFGLTGGNIFHGAMSPLRRPRSYRTPVRGLWLCGSSMHPGGGVLGAPGRNAARAIARSLTR